MTQLTWKGHLNVSLLRKKHIERFIALPVLSISSLTVLKLDDEESETKVLIATVQYLFDAQRWDGLNKKIEELTKVRGPIQKVPSFYFIPV
jgi:hypothetical protein